MATGGAVGLCLAQTSSQTLLEGKCLKAAFCTEECCFPRQPKFTLCSLLPLHTQAYKGNPTKMPLNRLASTQGGGGRGFAIPLVVLCWKRKRNQRNIRHVVHLKNMCTLSMYLEYNLIGCCVSVWTSWKVKKSFGICGGPAISLALCNPSTRRSMTNP